MLCAHAEATLEATQIRSEHLEIWPMKRVLCGEAPVPAFFALLFQLLGPGWHGRRLFISAALVNKAVCLEHARS
jgi:hypothetical protein